MHLLLTDLFKARWTDKIHDEWIEAVLRKGTANREKLERTRDLMDDFAMDAKVYDYESLIESISLPDPNDRHVVAAAIKGKADAIVTFNLKDFPESALNPFDLEVIHPDDFICYQIDLSPGGSCWAIKQQRKSLKNPPKTVKDFLMTLRRQQLPKTVSVLEKRYINFI